VLQLRRKPPFPLARCPLLLKSLVFFFRRRREEAAKVLLNPEHHLFNQYSPVPGLSSLSKELAALYKVVRGRKEAAAVPQLSLLYHLNGAAPQLEAQLPAPGETLLEPNSPLSLVHLLFFSFIFERRDCGD